MPKISQLPILTNINTGSIIPVVDNSRTQRISVGKLFEFLSGALDETFSTEFELMQSASAITSSFEILSSSINTTITNITINSASAPAGTISSSNQISSLGYATTGSNTFSGSVTVLVGNSLLVNRIENTTGGNIEIAASGLLSLSGDGGGVTTNDNFEANPGGNATFKVTSGSVSITGSISATGTNLISSSTQITALGFISESITDTGSLLLTSSFNTFSSSVHQRLLDATNEQILDGFVITSSFNNFTSSVVSFSSSFDQRIKDATNEQIIDGFLSTSSFNNFTSSIDSRVDGLEAATGSYLTSLNGAISSSGQITNLGFSTTGSNTFVDENVFQQKVTVNHDFVVTGSSLFGSGNFDEIAPEKFLVIQNDVNNYNIIVGKSETNNYSQILVTNLSNGISASSDIVAQADNGGETNMYADLGVNSSGYTGNGNGVGGANDAYVYGKAKNFYVGTLTTQSLYLFANESGSPEVILHSNVLTISSSVLVSGSISASSYVGLPIGLVSSSTQISGLGFAVTSSLAVVTPFLSSSDFNTFTSSYKTDSSSFDSRITAIVNTGAPAGTVSSSQQITNFGFATTSSVLNIDTSSLVTTSSFNSYTSSNDGKWDTIGNLTGSFITEAETGSFLTSIPNGVISSSAQITIQPAIYNGAATEIIAADGGYLELKTDDGNNSVSISDTFVTIYSNSNFWRFNTDGEFVLPDGTTQTTAFTGIPNGSISSSQQIVDLGFSTTGSNTFRNNQIISGNLNVEGAISASALQVTTFYAVSSSVSSTSGSTAFGTENTDVMSVTGSVRATNEISASSISGLGNATQYSASVSNRIDGATSKLGSIEASTASLNTFSSSVNTFTASLNGTNTFTASVNTFTASVNASGSILNIFTSSINSFTASVRASGSILNTFTSSVNTFTASLAGAVTTSAQITAFGFATTSSVVNVNTSSLVTTSSFNTFTSSYKTDSASFDSRITAGGGSTPAGTVSSSAQVTAYGFLLTSSFNTYTSSVSNAVSAAINTATSSLSSSVSLINASQLSTASFNTYSASLNRFTASAATTASNTFIGNQTISGSLVVSSLTTISSSISANSSSLYLTSGSNLIVQNNGLVEITGSITLSGSMTIQSGSITMPNRPAFRVTGAGGATTATTVLSGSMTNIDFNQGGWDNTTGTFTAPVAGLYQVNLVCRTSSNSSAQPVQAIVYKNNTTTSPGPDGTALIMIEWAANTTANHMGGSTICKLAVGDTLKAIITVGTASFDGNDNFSVAYIG